MLDSQKAFRLFSLMIILTITTIAAIACFGNITDSTSNMKFVYHIFEMDTTYHSPGVMYRAIDSNLMHWLGFWAIVVFEALVAITGYWGLYRLLKNINKSSDVFEKQKTLCFIAMFFAVVIWGFIFQAGGGEWFVSWQSASWNGLRDATRIVLLAVGGGITLRLAK